jgi:hypothetical protein
MKKILSILIVLTVLVSSVNATDEKPNATAGLAVLKSKTGFKLFYKGNKKSDVKVTIYNASGETVHKETVRNTESFARPYNLESLNDGDYTVEVRDASGAQIKKVNYAHKKAQLLAKLTAIPGEANKYVLTLAKTSDISNISVKIYDATGTLVYSQNETIAKDFAKVYNLAKVSAKFSVEVEADNGVAQMLAN